MTDRGTLYRKWAGIVSNFLLCFAVGTAARAQGPSGAIAGTVTDPAGIALQGARVAIDAKDVHVISNEQGRYYISALPPGDYSLTVSYVGFARFTKAIAVAPGQTLNLNAQLQVESAKQSVLVSASRATGEVEAVNIERSADNILQVLPSQVITSLPNANMADALGRMPSVTLERDEGEGKYVQVRGTEPRLTNTTVDGVSLPSEEPGVRQIKFDALPAGIVDSVQVSKTLQANMDGDGIGGSVNLITRTATDTPTLQLEGLGGYTPIISGRGNTTETGTWGQRFGANKKFGFIISGSYDWEGRGIDDIEPVPDVATLPDGSRQLWFDAQDIREYKYFRSRWGLAGSADYRIADGSNLYARFLLSDFKNYGDAWAYSLADNTPNVSLLAPGNAGGGPSFYSQLRNPDLGLGSLVLGGTHVLKTTWYSWQAYAARSFYGNSPFSTARFSSNIESSSCQYDPSATKDHFVPQWNSACFAEAYDARNQDMSLIRRNLGHAAQLNLGIAGSGAKQYHIGSNTATFEYGGRFRNDHKFSNTYNLNIYPNGTVPLSTFPSSVSNSSYYNGGAYKLGPLPAYDEIIHYVNANPGDFTFDYSDKGADLADYNLVEKVSAGYVMNSIDFANRFRWVAGLRAEVTHNAVRNLSQAPDGSISPFSFSGSYYNLLPSTSLRFGVGANSFLRLIYARGLSRPDEQDIAQNLSWSDTCNGSNRYCASLGNANLRAETGDDIDFLFDHYFSGFGVVSAGYFYKHLQDPIIQGQAEVPNFQPPGGPQGTYLISQPTNAGSAWLSGFEMSYLQHFTFLPGAFAGLGMSANYSYIGSKTSGIQGRSDHPRLLRNSPNMFNISPTYDRGRYSARMGISYNQANIYAYQYADGMPDGVNGPLSDTYFYNHTQVDAQGSVGLGRGLDLIISGLNLTNEVFGFYQGSPQYMIQREYYQPTYTFGLKWTPVHER